MKNISNAKANFLATLIVVGVMAILFFVSIFLGHLADWNKNYSASSVPLNMPDYFEKGEKNNLLTKKMEECVDKYFNVPSNPWYRGDLDKEIIKIRLCDIKQDNHDFITNGETIRGKYIAVNKVITYENKKYNAEEILRTGKNMDILENIIIHELIHSYVDRYSLFQLHKSLIHEGMFKEIADWFLTQDTPFNDNYIKDRRDYI